MHLYSIRGAHSLTGACIQKHIHTVTKPIVHNYSLNLTHWEHGFSILWITLVKIYSSTAICCTKRILNWPWPFLSACPCMSSPSHGEVWGFDGCRGGRYVYVYTACCCSDSEALWRNSRHSGYTGWQRRRTNSEGNGKVLLNACIISMSSQCGEHRCVYSLYVKV